jgi:hypothetical protein
VDGVTSSEVGEEEEGEGTEGEVAEEGQAHVNGINGVSNSKISKTRSRATPPPPSAHSSGPESVVIVAATAQEPRLGRWMRVKESGASGVKLYVVNPKAKGLGTSGSGMS